MVIVNSWVQVRADGIHDRLQTVVNMLTAFSLNSFTRRT